jgi:hypothetical protein
MRKVSQEGNWRHDAAWANVPGRWPWQSGASSEEYPPPGLARTCADDRIRIGHVIHLETRHASGSSSNEAKPKLDYIGSVSISQFHTYSRGKSKLNLI